MERDLSGSRLMRPFSSSAFKCTCTVEGEERPRLWQTSRTVGPYPFSRMHSSMQSSTACWRFVTFSAIGNPFVASTPIEQMYEISIDMNLCSTYYIREQRFYARAGGHKMKNFEMNCPRRGNVGPSTEARFGACSTRPHHSVPPACGSARSRRRLHRFGRAHGFGARRGVRPRAALAGGRRRMRVRGARTRQPVRRVLAETFPGPARPFHNPQMLRFCGCVAPPPPRRRVRSGVYAPLAAC